MNVLPRKKSRASEIYDALRTLIVTLELPPKEVLQEKELCDRFEVSRTPLREALLRLADHGLVTIAPQHGTFVSGISPNAVRQAHFLRVNLEIPVVLKLCDTPDLDLTVPQSILLEQKLAAQQNSYAVFMPLDDRFHQSLFELAELGSVWQVIHTKKAHLDRIRFLKAAERSELESLTRQHEAILDAIARHSRLGAEELVRAHVSGSVGFMEQILRSRPELFDDGGGAGLC